MGRMMVRVSDRGGDDEGLWQENNVSEEPSYEDVVHALRVRLAGSPRLRELPAEDISDDLLKNANLPTKPDPTLVRRALEEINRDSGGAA